MAIERDDGVEPHTRLDLMITEFREAQSRRVRNTTNRVVDVQPTADTTTHPTEPPAPARESAARQKQLPRD